MIQADVLRHTPAGVPSISLTLRHQSQQEEAGKQAAVQFETIALAYGVVAMEIAAIEPGQHVSIKGFINRKNRFSEMPVMHITDFKLLN